MRIAGVGFRAGNAHPYGPTAAGDAQHGATSAIPSRVEPSASRTRRVVPTTSIVGAGDRSCCERAVEGPATTAAARQAARRTGQRSNRPRGDMRPAYTFRRGCESA